MPGPPTPADTADALAIAICHVWRGGAVAKLEQAARKQAQAAALAGAR
jgi:crossover junction endodeoxyribonuclease RuvC